MCLRLAMRSDLIIGPRYHEHRARSRDVPALLASSRRVLLSRPEVSLGSYGRWIRQGSFLRAFLIATRGFWMQLTFRLSRGGSPWS
jgi:hypothetical protein